MHYVCVCATHKKEAYIGRTSASALALFFPNVGVAASPHPKPKKKETGKIKIKHTFN